MARNRSEKGPQVLMRKTVTYNGDDIPVTLTAKTNGFFRLQVQHHGNTKRYKYLIFSTKSLATEVYHSIEDGFYYSQLPHGGWRWANEGDRDGA